MTGKSHYSLQKLDAIGHQLGGDFQFKSLTNICFYWCFSNADRFLGKIFVSRTIVLSELYIILFGNIISNILYYFLIWIFYSCLSCELCPSFTNAARVFTYIKLYDKFNSFHILLSYSDSISLKHIKYPGPLSVKSQYKRFKVLSRLSFYNNFLSFIILYINHLHIILNKLLSSWSWPIIFRRRRKFAYQNIYYMKSLYVQVINKVMYL